MKCFALVAMAMIASANARVVVLQLEAAFHTDEWCADHHLGKGPSTCIQHSGCCYDGRIGICHSCDAHSDKWCSTYGGVQAKTCIAYAGCTFNFDKSKDGECVSAKDPADFEVAVVTCEEELSKATQADPQPTYIPNCADDGEWGFEQEDTKEVIYKGLTWKKGDKPEMTTMKWCLDEEGHEIPNTRNFAKDFKQLMINCEKERKKHHGLQCPNAVTLNTGNGEVMLNDHEDVGNCDITCNTDMDCKGEQWCCYNGCGYSCQVPIKPKADCKHLILDTGVMADNLDVQHDNLVTVQCAGGFAGSDPVQITCRHGTWDDYKMDCKKDCEQYRIVDGRDRDYDISGKGFHHNDKRKLKCVNGYGAVAGSPDAVRFYKETVTCINGAWEPRTLECSACFDAPNDGPHAWWTGIEDGSKRPESFDCQFFASRPLKCAEFPKANDHCRISCRTCEENLMKYKVKAVRSNVDGAKNPDKWLASHVRSLEGFRPWVTVQFLPNGKPDPRARTKVAVRVKKNQD